MTDSSGTRNSLLSRARDRDSQAWSALVDLYGPLIAHWCYRCGLDSHAAADCVQEVFSAVAGSLDRFAPQAHSGSFRAWLWRITSNKLKDRARAVLRQTDALGGSTALHALQNIPDTQQQVDEEQAAGEFTDEPTEPEQLRDLISRAMQQVRLEFEPRSWDIFRRCVIDELPTAVVAQEFCVTPAAVRQTRSRVLRRLRQQLGDIE